MDGARLAGVRGRAAPCRVAARPRGPRGGALAGGVGRRAAVRHGLKAGLGGLFAYSGGAKHQIAHICGRVAAQPRGPWRGALVGVLGRLPFYTAWLVWDLNFSRHGLPGRS